MALDREHLDSIRQLIGERLLAQLTNPEAPTRASMVNAAISYLKLWPQYLDKLGTDSQAEIADGLRRTLAEIGRPLPFFEDGERNPDFDSNDDSDDE
jgi:hypothetical protein